MPYFISGKERREKKKVFHQLKRCVKMFWFYEDIDRVYGGGHTDEQCKVLIEELNRDIKILESKLNETINVALSI